MSSTTYTQKPKHQEFEIPETLGNDWGTYRPITQMRAKMLQDPVSVKTKKGYENAEEGDWIVIDHEGNSSLVAADDFNSTYTPVPPSKQDTHFGQTP